MDLQEFNPDKYKKTGWIVRLSYLEMDNFLPRLIIHVATGRKFWCLFSEVINPDLGLDDPGLIALETSLYYYTFPMIDRFISELEAMLVDVYQIEVKLNKPKNHL